MSRVYAVNLPAYFNWGSNPNTLGIDVIPGATTYALKIVHEHKEYAQEVEALSAIAKMAAKNSTSFYAIGAVPGSSSSKAALFDGGTWPLCKVDTRDVNPFEKYWWSSRKDNIDECGQEGGAIIMLYGRALDAESEWKEVVLGICNSLRLAHSANVLHCDIRRSNVLRFDYGWGLIDFGLSCLVDSQEPYQLINYGAQAAGAGPRVRRCLENNNDIYWTVADDYEMLLKMIDALP
jgi:serine/threonine protein kinase